jgi:hypothetical protein
MSKKKWLAVIQIKILTMMAVQLSSPCMFEAKVGHQSVSLLHSCHKFASMEH